MDKYLEKLHQLYPSSYYVKIAPYTEEEETNQELRKKNKAPLNFWQSKNFTYDMAQEWVTKYNGRVGWVVPEFTVVVDIDNHDHPESEQYIQKILDEHGIKYSYNRTYQGMHFIFRDDTGKIRTLQGMKNGLGLVCDTRAQNTGYIILPCNDANRSWGQWSEIVDNMPKWLIPQGNHDSVCPIGMGNGDGRNDWIFRWTTFLYQCKKIDKDAMNECLRIINKFLFSAPMEDKELFTAGRLDGKAQSQRERKESKFHEVACRILDKHKYITYGDVFFEFNGHYYERKENIEIERVIYEEENNLSSNGRKEVFKFMTLRTQVRENELDAKWNEIACGNGLLDLYHRELRIATEKDINTIHIDIDYNPNPKESPLIIDFMKKITGGDPAKERFLYEVAGYTLLKENKFHKFFIFQGEGGTGKSTFCNLIRRMVGKRNIANVPLDKFDDNYHLVTLVSKLVNIDDDNDATSTHVLENTGKFKSIVAGETISVRQIFCPVINMTAYATIIINCNKIPRIMDKSSGLFRRMILVELNNVIKEPNTNFMRQLTDMDMEYFLFKSVEAISAILDTGKFTINMGDQQLMRKFRCRQSSLNEWIYENQLSWGDIYMKTVRSLHIQYKTWCDYEGHRNQVMLGTFKEDMCILFRCEIVFEDPQNKRGEQIFWRLGTQTEEELKRRPF